MKPLSVCTYNYLKNKLDYTDDYYLKYKKEIGLLYNDLFPNIKIKFESNTEFSEIFINLPLLNTINRENNFNTIDIQQKYLNFGELKTQIERPYKPIYYLLNNTKNLYNLQLLYNYNNNYGVNFLYNSNLNAVNTSSISLNPLNIFVEKLTYLFSRTVSTVVEEIQDTNSFQSFEYGLPYWKVINFICSNLLTGAPADSKFKSFISSKIHDNLLLNLLYPIKNKINDSAEYNRKIFLQNNIADLVIKKMLFNYVTEFPITDNDVLSNFRTQLQTSSSVNKSFLFNYLSNIDSTNDDLFNSSYSNNLIIQNNGLLRDDLVNKILVLNQDKMANNEIISAQFKTDTLKYINSLYILYNYMSSNISIDLNNIKPDVLYYPNINNLHQFLNNKDNYIAALTPNLINYALFKILMDSINLVMSQDFILTKILKDIIPPISMYVTNVEDFCFQLTNFIKLSYIYQLFNRVTKLGIISSSSNEYLTLYTNHFNNFDFTNLISTNNIEDYLQGLQNQTSIEVSENYNNIKDFLTSCFINNINESIIDSYRNG
jgi:hypothetical protein